VASHGGVGDAEVSGDLSGALAPPEPVEHLELPRGQLDRPVRRELDPPGIAALAKFADELGGHLTRKGGFAIGHAAHGVG